MIFIAKLRHRRYRRAMMRAINKATAPISSVAVRVSRSYGLRVIREFEQINDVVFDPFDLIHVDMVHGKAVHLWFSRRTKRLIDDMRPIGRTLPRPVP